MVLEWIQSVKTDREKSNLSVHNLMKIKTKTNQMKQNNSNVSTQKKTVFVSLIFQSREIIEVL